MMKDSKSDSHHGGGLDLEYFEKLEQDFNNSYGREMKLPHLEYKHAQFHPNEPRQVIVLQRMNYPGGVKVVEMDGGGTQRKKASGQPVSFENNQRVIRVSLNDGGEFAEEDEEEQIVENSSSDSEDQDNTQVQDNKLDKPEIQICHTMKPLARKMTLQGGPSNHYTRRKTSQKGKDLSQDPASRGISESVDAVLEERKSQSIGQVPITFKKQQHLSRLSSSLQAQIFEDPKRLKVNDISESEEGETVYILSIFDLDTDSALSQVTLKFGGTISVYKETFIVTPEAINILLTEGNELKSCLNFEAKNLKPTHDFGLSAFQIKADEINELKDPLFFTDRVDASIHMLLFMEYSLLSVNLTLQKSHSLSITHGNYIVYDVAQINEEVILAVENQRQDSKYQYKLFFLPLENFNDPNGFELKEQSSRKVKITIPEEYLNFSSIDLTMKVLAKSHLFLSVNVEEYLDPSDSIIIEHPCMLYVIPLEGGGSITQIPFESKPKLFIEGFLLVYSDVDLAFHVYSISEFLEGKPQKKVQKIAYQMDMVLDIKQDPTMKQEFFVLEKIHKEDGKKIRGLLVTDEKCD
ncbi:hypothetical protein FGO68_gene14443 [Halteria grandinella]|uniref:Uncharacterized protein n=1 Tax=Halteria grandinella TaxID=5974 RepID=A0A8J8T9N0_HALGN|nr:hypothetical protein FGO68_gene14443 [Halteria grandinella]